MANKLLKIRLWPDAEGKAWSKCVTDLDYEVLLVSQFTLYHKMKANKPDFHDAMDNEEAKNLYDMMLGYLRKTYRPDRVFPGAFGQLMAVELVGDGPVTIALESIYDEKAVKKLEK